MSKDSVTRLNDLIKHHLESQTKRGNPLSSKDKLLLCLQHLGSGSFQRSSGDCMQVSQYVTWKSIGRVYDAIITLEQDFLYYPDAAEQQATARRMFEKYNIPYLYLAVDGTQIRFEEAPRGIPDFHNKQHYRNWKQYDSVNAMIVGNDQRIVAVDATWPGSAHDARVWNMSEVKRIVEAQNEYMIVGDSAYGISEHLVKPFSNAEINSEANEARKRKMVRFNKKLCGARTVMSENLYGTLKRRWPILKNMRHHMDLAQKAIKVCCILENMCRDWIDGLPEDEEENRDDNDNVGNGAGPVAAGNLVTRGKAKRMWLMEQMSE